MNQVALCVGHSRTVGNTIEGGATAWDNHENEWHFNCRLVALVQAELKQHKIASVIYSLYRGATYFEAQKWLAEQIKQSGCNSAIEFHFNSAGPLAHGHEVLCWHNSVKGLKLAKIEEEELKHHFNTPARGVKQITSKSERGAPFLYLTHCPAIILEPFFGSSQEDWKAVAEKEVTLAEVIAGGIEVYYNA